LEWLLLSAFYKDFSLKFTNFNSFASFIFLYKRQKFCCVASEKLQLFGYVSNADQGILVQDAI